MSQDPRLSSASGAPIPDNDTSITAGARGPLLLQDHHLLDKLAHFNRERIPERVVHAKGAGAFGTFRVTHDITRYSKAAVFARIGQETPVLGRFSTVAGELGAADTVRDVRGFSLKFYTEQGNWDMVGNNTPVFFVRDPSKFPDFIHTQKRDPQTHCHRSTMQWDFWSLVPESLHQVTILFSDRGIPAGIPYMHGFGSHTYSLINAANERVWVKFHFKSQQGIKCLAPEEAVRLAGSDPDYHTRELFNGIARGEYPRWTLKIQVMTEEQARQVPWNPFDLTRVWPHAEFPLQEVGVLELNRNPANYFAEIEQAGFSPANVVPGISFSPDKMLQARLFAYADAHRYRLGANYETLPVNAPRCPVRNYQRDGAMRFGANGGASVNYAPNSFGGPVASPEHDEPPLALAGAAARHEQTRGVSADYEQPGQLYRLMSPAQRAALEKNLAGSLAEAPRAIQERMLGHLRQADPAYGAGVARHLGLA